jgi:hypothetical protein
MIIDIITGIKFTKEEFVCLVGRHAFRELEIEKSKQWKSRYILERNWDSLVVVLIDNSGIEYNCVRPSSMRLYLGDLTVDERNGIGLVMYDKLYSTNVKGLKLIKKDINMNAISTHQLMRREKQSSYFLLPSTKEKNKKSAKDWAEKNADRHRESRRRGSARRRLNNPNIKLRECLRNRMNDAVKGKSKSAKTMELIGCDITTLRNHLESLFQEGMTWDNRGCERVNKVKSWHMDHIIPCSYFDLLDPEQQKLCFHYTNLQPLWETDNTSKGNKILW